MLLIIISTSWVAGILLGAAVNLPLWSLALALVPLPSLIVLRRQKKLLLIASLCVLALCGGAIRYQSGLPVLNEEAIHFYNDGGTVTFRGIVIADPDVRDKNTRLTLAAREIKVDGDWQAVTGRVLLFVPRYPEYSYGDVLAVTGKLETPPRLDDFDYQGYLANRGIYATVRYPAIAVLERGQGFAPLAWLYTVRQMLAEKLAAVLPEPQAALAQGIILGMRGNIPQTVQDDFSRTGTAHILAISGLHLNIMAGILVSTGIWIFGKRHYLYVWLALAAIWVYALLTGLNPPIVRAAVMLTLFLMADVLGRQRSVLTALAFAGGVMVAITPRLLWDASFQLSFLAMLGLVLVVPVIKAPAKKLVTGNLGESGVLAATAAWMTDSIAVTLGVTLVVWPVIAHYFGLFSFVAPFATLLVLPSLPFLIISGALTAVLGVVVLPIGQVVGWLAWLFLSYLLAVVRGFAGLTTAATVFHPHPVFIGGYFAVLALVLWLYARRARLAAYTATATRLVSRLPKQWVVPPLLAMALMATLFAVSMPDDRVHISFLDVGQGDAILIQAPGNQDILVDGGPGAQAVNLELGRRLPFWDRTIELMVLTHPHADHLAGLVEVLKRYRVRQVLYPATDSQSPLWREWQDLVARKGIKATAAQAGQVVELGGGGARIEVLAPFSVGTGTIEYNTVVLRLTAGGVSFLLTADISQEVEFDLITRRAGLPSTVLKVSHHGSDTATSPEFLAVVNPQAAVISVGVDNGYGHPHRAVVIRLSEEVGAGNIYRTDENGTIEFITDGEKLWVKKDR